MHRNHTERTNKLWITEVSAAKLRRFYCFTAPKTLFLKKLTISLYSRLAFARQKDKAGCSSYIAGSFTTTPRNVWCMQTNEEVQRQSSEQACRHVCLRHSSEWKLYMHKCHMVTRQTPGVKPQVQHVESGAEFGQIIQFCWVKISSETAAGLYFELKLAR